MNWEVVENKIEQKMETSDKRWSISKTQDNEKSVFFLINRDLMLTPSGMGSSQKDCFEVFIKECDTYLEKVRKTQEEAKEYLKQLEAEE